MSRLGEYARSEVNTESVKEALGDSFIGYLTELRNTDLGIKTQRKFQMPISAGKSVSLEEVELYYKNKAQGNKNKKETNNSAEPKNAVKRGRPQGSKNKKKSKIQEKKTKKITIAYDNQHLQKLTRNEAVRLR